MVDKVVGEELSEPMLEAKLDVMLEVKLDAKGFTTEKTLFGVCLSWSKYFCSIENLFLI